MRREVKINCRRKHIFTDKMKALAAGALAQKGGYLRVEDLPGSSIFATLPRQHFNPKRIIRPKNALCVVSGGLVQIRHPQHRFLVKELMPGALFGDTPLLGQTMLATEARAGAEGALISFVSPDTAREWVKSNPIEILEKNRLKARFHRLRALPRHVPVERFENSTLTFRVCGRRSNDIRTDARNDRPQVRDVARDRDEHTQHNETGQTY